MAKKSPVQWANRCTDGRVCAYRGEQAAFIPDDYDVCNGCLEAIYGLEAGYDHCDQLGMGSRHFDEEAVLKVLRLIRKGEL